MKPEPKRWSSHEITKWLEDLISRELNLPIEEVRKIKRFDALGVDSILAAYISSELKEKLDRPVSIDVVYDNGDIYTLAANMGD